MVTTTPAMTGKDRAMPNNSDQAALHDELRARLLDVQSQAGKAATQSAYTAAGEKAIRMIPELIAALTLPASEAVAPFGWWDHFNEHLYRDKVSADNAAVGGNLVTPLYTTPQPSPAAHAGGEAVAYVSASELALHRELGGLIVGSSTPEPTRNVPLYTTPQPAPAAMVEGLREKLLEVVDDRIVELAERLVAIGPKAAHVSASECHEITDAIYGVAALLSGGAAREGK